MEEDLKTLPYHLSIVPIIKNLELSEVFFFKKVIKSTQIPANPDTYDEIIKTWKKRMKELSFLDSSGVVENLEKRKSMIRR